MLFLLFLYSTITSADELKISSGPNNELILTSSDCESLLKTENALCEWKNKIDPTFIISKNLSKSCIPLSNKKFKLSITACLPEIAKSFHSKKMIKDGPNCWGTAMSLNGLSSTPRFMWPEEMMYWMDNSKICRKLSPGEKPIPGDIINIYAPEKMDEKERAETDAGTNFWEFLFPGRLTRAQGDVGGTDYTGYQRLLHSVTFISEALAYGKDSPSRLDKFYFHPLNEVYGRPYETECQENQELNPYLRENQNPPKKIKGSKCSYFSTAYRCDNVSEYFNGMTLKDYEKESWNRILALKIMQEKLFPLLFNLKNIDKKSIQSMSLLAEKSLSQSAEELKARPLDKNKEMLLAIEYFTAAGIQHSLIQLGLVKP